MLHRITIAGIGVAAAAVAGTAAFAGAHGGGHSAAGPADTSTAIRVQTATVNGKSEAVLTDARGMPLYYYAPDTPSTSMVSGTLAALWPAVTASSTPTAHGLAGNVTEVSDSHGRQVAYNGHLLYTFVSDRQGVVTGQGEENFFVATPTLSAQANTSQPSPTDMNPYGAY
jgi:predicted lipoprotein with Yx(FWY)xxD motif